MKKTNITIFICLITICVIVLYTIGYGVGYKDCYNQLKVQEISVKVTTDMTTDTDTENPWTEEMLAQAMPIEYCSADAMVDISGLNEADVEYLFQLSEAVALKETLNDPTKVGAAGEIGALQILPGAIIDVNQRFKTNYCIQDMVDTPVAKEVFILYLTRYGKKYIKIRDSKSLARIWNGGPTGASKRCTVKYGNDVMAIMEAICQN